MSVLAHLWQRTGWLARTLTLGWGTIATTLSPSCPPSLSILPPEGHVQFSFLSAFSLSLLLLLFLLLTVPISSFAAECGPSCASSGSCLPRCVIGGWGPFQPPWEHRPDRFHNFSAHDAQLYRPSENKRTLQRPWVRTWTQILSYCCIDPNESEKLAKKIFKKQQHKKTSACLWLLPVSSLAKHSWAGFLMGHHPAVPSINSDLWRGRRRAQKEKGQGPKICSFYIVLETLQVASTVFTRRLNTQNYYSKWKKYLYTYFTRNVF